MTYWYTVYIGYLLNGAKKYFNSLDYLEVGEQGAKSEEKPTC